MKRGKQNYAEKIFKILAETRRPLNPFEIMKNWDKLLNLCHSTSLKERKSLIPSYSRIYEAISKLKTQGYVQTETIENASKKHNKLVVCSLTFKGTLKYLSQFDQEGITTLFDQETEKQLLAFIIRQGDAMGYPLFQECQWLYECNKNVIRYFVSESKALLEHPLTIDAAIAEDYYKHKEEKFNLRASFGSNYSDYPKSNNVDNDEESLMLDFAEHFFIWGLGMLAVKETDSNLRLSSFANEILENALWKIGFLENAVKVFSGKDFVQKS